MQNQKALDVLNDLETIDFGADGDPYILVEDNADNRQRLNGAGVSNGTIDRYSDGDSFCILSLAFAEGFADGYDAEKGGLFIQGNLNKHMDEFTDLIEQWAKDRGLDKSDSRGQVLKGVEEFGELAEAINKGDMPGTYDGIGDMYVVLTILAKQQGVSIQDCVGLAYNEIKDRTGEMKDGVFIKSDDL